LDIGVIAEEDRKIPVVLAQGFQDLEGITVNPFRPGR
jgi:hypothetical protein